MIQRLPWAMREQAQDGQNPGIYDPFTFILIVFRLASAYVQGIAIAEVAKAPGVPTVPNPYYVVAKDEFIMPRFFFVWKGCSESLGANDLNLSSLC